MKLVPRHGPNRADWHASSLRAGFPLTIQKVRISTGCGTDAAWGKNGGNCFAARQIEI